MVQLKKIAILGSTGSIGTQALDVVARHPDRFQVVALAAGAQVDRLLEQARRFRPRLISVRNKEDVAKIKPGVGAAKVVWGDPGAVEVAADSGADLVLSAIVGAAGLRPTLAALRAGKTVALANKESLVIAGELMTGEARRSGARLLPVDSEHSAIFQCLASGKPEEVKRLVLTASGGPFLNRPRETFAAITVEEALQHPNWKMGPKITVDSATLMNKGLELIEARWLFGFPPEQIDIQIHPQSIVHSMVEFCDGSVIAQLGTPDMRCAISHALAWPDRIASGVEPLSLTKAGSLTFFDPDPEKFPALRLARHAAEGGGSLPVVLNAANEAAVDKFLRKKIGFLDITRHVETVMSRHQRQPVRSIEELLELDRWAREIS